MLALAKILVFFLACGFLFGLTLLLFRDQLGPRRPAARAVAEPPAVPTN
jgi:hypothetical protein